MNGSRKSKTPSSEENNVKTFQKLRCSFANKDREIPKRLKCSVMSRIGCENLEDIKHLDEGTFYDL